MVPKWMYPLAFAFVIFLIYSDATAAGSMAGRFAQFIVDLLSAIGEFLTGLFEGAGAGSTRSSSSSNAPSVQTTLTTLAAQTSDTFTHTHDGITHSHPTVAG